MKWSIKIGRFAGIDVYMHVTFLLLVSWVALLHWRQGQSIAATVAGVAFILTVFLMRGAARIRACADSQTLWYQNA